MTTSPSDASDAPNPAADRPAGAAAGHRRGADPPLDDAPDAAPGLGPLDLLTALGWGCVVALTLTPVTVLLGGSKLLDPFGLGGGALVSVARVGLSLCAGATACGVLAGALAKRRPRTRLRPFERAVVTAAPAWVAGLVVASLPVPLVARFLGLGVCGVAIPYVLSRRLNARRPGTAEDAYKMCTAGAVAGAVAGMALSVVGSVLLVAPYERLAAATIPGCTVWGSVVCVWISYRVSAW